MKDYFSYPQEVRKNIVSCMSIIFSSLDVATFDPEVLLLIKKNHTINQSGEDISDDDWVRVMDLYLLMESYFSNRRAWILNNCGCRESFFELYG